MRSIGPFDALPAGTRVQVKDKRGTVISHTFAPNAVCVHTILLHEQYHHYGDKRGWRPCPTRTWRGNYSFVQVMD